MADSPDLQRLLQDKHEAVRAYREASDDSARAIAWDGVDAASKALDAALVDRETSRADDERMAAAEARDRAAQMIGDAQASSAGHLPLDEIRAYAEKKSNQVTFSLQPEKRVDLIKETGNYGGAYVVGQSWVNNVTMFALAQSGVLKAGPTIIQTADGRQINFPKLSADMSAIAGTEGAVATLTAPTFTTVALNSYRIDGYVPISDEILRDDIVNLESVLAALAGRALGVKQASYLADIDVGTGSSLPNAITKDSVLGCTAVSTTVPTMDELKTLLYSLLPQYRLGASFIANTTLTLSMALAKDDDGQYLWNPSMVAGEPDRLWGKSWYEDAYMDESATGNIPVVCGDIGAGFVVRYAGGIEVSFSRDFAFTSFETTMRFAMHFDSASIDTAAIHHLVLA
jgi:HK97 family phage major capsid protein